jgi:hypothetical protein
MVRRYNSDATPGGPAQLLQLIGPTGCGSGQRLYIVPNGNVSGVGLRQVHPPARETDGPRVVYSGQRLDLAATLGIPLSDKDVAVWVDFQGGVGTSVQILHDDGICDDCKR